MQISWLGLEGKSVIVTGAASGIGKAVAQEFLNCGANVAVCDLNPQTPEFEINENKYLKYIFGGENKDGLAKGRAMESRLGYNIDNYNEFDKLIKSNIGKYPARHKDSTPHGEKYEVNIVVRGLKGKQAKILVGVMDDGIPKLTTLYIDKLKESDLRYE